MITSRVHIPVQTGIMGCTSTQHSMNDLSNGFPPLADPEEQIDTEEGREPSDRAIGALSIIAEQGLNVVDLQDLAAMIVDSLIEAIEDDETIQTRLEVAYENLTFYDLAEFFEQEPQEPFNEPIVLN